MQLESINGRILTLVTMKRCFINVHLLYGLCFFNRGEPAQTGDLWEELSPDSNQQEKLLVVDLLQVINKSQAATRAMLVCTYTA